MRHPVNKAELYTDTYTCTYTDTKSNLSTSKSNESREVGIFLPQGRLTLYAKIRGRCTELKYTRVHTDTYTCASQCVW